ncbi:MAG: hypothetical protein AAF202_06100 [Pseudomonadota bacterium]
MKIDDPRVQDYIKGQLNSDEEAALFDELKNYPEVADLAETLKRTQSLIQEDIESGTVPETAKSSSSPTGLQKTFEPMMGKNWRVELALLSGGVAVLLVILIGVPLVRTLEKRAQSDASGNKFNQSISEESDSGFTGKGAQVVHEAQGRSQAQGFSSAEQLVDFEAALIEEPGRELREASSHFVELTKNMSAAAVSDKNKIALPVQLDVDLGYEMREQIAKKKLLPKEKVGPQELVNSFEPSAAADFNEPVRLTLTGTSAPWKDSKSLVSATLEVNPNLRVSEEKVSRAIVFLGASSQLVSKFSLDSGKAIYSGLQEASSSLTSKSRGEPLHLIVFLWRALSSGESLLLSRWVKKEGLRLSIVDTTAAQRERIRKEVGPEKDRVYLSAPTPVLVKKAYYNYQAGKGDPIQDVSLLLKPDESQGSGWFGPLASGSYESRDLPRHNWLFAGERVSSVIEFDPKSMGQGDSPVVAAVVEYRKNHDSPKQGEVQETITASEFESNSVSIGHVQLVSLSWLGRILQGARPLTEREFLDLVSYAEPLQGGEVYRFIKETEALYF